MLILIRTLRQREIEKVAEENQLINNRTDALTWFICLYGSGSKHHYAGNLKIKEVTMHTYKMGMVLLITDHVTIVNKILKIILQIVKFAQM